MAGNLKSSTATVASSLSGTDRVIGAQGYPSAPVDAVFPLSALATWIIAQVVAAAPSTLDTLNELAAALGNDASFATTMTTALAGKQPLDSDLTAIAALATTSFGRSVLTLADAAALRTLAGAVIGTDVQAYDSDLAAIAALATTSFGRSLLTMADAAALRSTAGTAPAVEVLSPTNGSTVTPSNTSSLYKRVYLNHGSTIATLTINMPSSPVDGQSFQLRTGASSAVTTLTMSGGSNTLRAPLAAVAADDGGSWEFVAAATTWFRSR